MNTLTLEKHCWAEIDLTALRENYEYIRRTVGGPVCAVVKADAYGHGDNVIARVLQEAGAAGFAVSSLGEGRHLRRGGITTPILILGYADGYPRQLSCGKGIVEIHGTPCPVLGRVCMDQMMVDLSAVPGTVQEGDEAILWGGTVSDSAEDIARKTDTISYEVLCGVSRRVPRVYLEHGTTAAVEDWILND